MMSLLNRKRRLLPLVAAVLLVLAVPPDALAQSKEQAARDAARQHNAKVLSVKEQKQGGQTVYVIKLLTRDGVVKTVRVTPRNR